MHEIKGPGQLCARDEGARATLCASCRGLGSSVRKIKGPEPLCVRDEGARQLCERKGPGPLSAREEGARAALYVEGRGQSHSVRERFFYLNFFTATLHFLHFLDLSEK